MKTCYCQCLYDNDCYQRHATFHSNKDIDWQVNSHLRATPANQGVQNQWQTKQNTTFRQSETRQVKYWTTVNSSIWATTAVTRLTKVVLGCSGRNESVYRESSDCSLVLSCLPLHCQLVAHRSIKQCTHGKAWIRRKLWIVCAGGLRQDLTAMRMLVRG